LAQGAAYFYVDALGEMIHIDFHITKLFDKFLFHFHQTSLASFIYAAFSKWKRLISLPLIFHFLASIALGKEIG